MARVFRLAGYGRPKARASGGIFEDAVGIPNTRITGWCAHIMEQYENKRARGISNKMDAFASTPDDPGTAVPWRAYNIDVMMIREPAVAGMFYPNGHEPCLSGLRDCLEEAQRPARGAGPASDVGKIIGGVVPHAGWACSGAVAARVFKQIAEQRKPAVAVVFGAIHVPLYGPRAYLFPTGAWETPLGLARVDERLADRLAGQTGLLEADAHAHDREHSIEVEVPFIQHLLPESLIIPIMVPVNENAAALGAAIGRGCKNYGVDAIFLASTDLTHYGPGYDFTPHGVGPEGLRWAKETNDRRMIDLMLAMRETDAVKEAVANRNACGAGAIAATIAACKDYGAARATLLEHTTSHEVLSGAGVPARQGPMRDAVGYAGIAFSE